MIGINAITSYIPEEKIDNLKQADKFNESQKFITDKIGALHLPVMNEGDDTSDMAVRAVRALVDNHGLNLNDIDALVVVTQNGDGAGLPHTSAIVQAKLGLTKNIAAFDISLGCSGYVYGLSILKGLMEQAGLKNGILVTADPYSKIIDRDDRVTTLLFGDAATATWLTESGVWKFMQPLLETDGSGASNLFVENNLLSMNGRQVFNFAAKQVPLQINKFLDTNKLTAEDIDLYCIHQGSAFIVDAVARRFPSVKERFVIDIENTGNTISSSIPLLLEKRVLDSENNKILISGFGVGLSWATNILYRES